MDTAAPDFDPAAVAGAQRLPPDRVAVPGDERHPGYVYEHGITMAVRVALATGRPLLVTGEPGVGKSTLAASIARVGGFAYREQVVTSRTQARDLMWRYDAVRRLADAQARKLRPTSHYVKPQALWWAFDPAGAAAFAGEAAPVPLPPLTVVLIDEIDKAEPDVPNDLLEALDRGQFTVDDLDAAPQVKGRRHQVLMLITSNRERELPPAFLRRCVWLALPPPTEDWLVTVADARFGAADQARHRALARRVMALRGRIGEQAGHRPGTAEYLDALNACRSLGIGLEAPDWGLVERHTLWKRSEDPAP